MSLLLKFQSPSPGYSLTFEDNGRTGYAHLKYDDRILGDLWLYNRCVAPDISEWDDRSNAPFANCSGFFLEGTEVAKTITGSDVIVDWEVNESRLVAFLYVFENLYGMLGLGDKPGYARLAIKDGPVAKRMELENEESRPIYP